MDDKRKFLLEEAIQRCKKYRHRILDISQRVDALHIAPALSCLEITDIIYHHLMRLDHNHNFLDTLIMPKGYGFISQYVVLHDLGYLSEADLLSYCQPYGRFGAYPDYRLPRASNGALGHGLEIAVGIAVANRLQNIDSHTYVILSDDELQESSTWEAITIAANLHLTSLTVFLDLHDFSGVAHTSINHPVFYPVIEKLLEIGWYIYDVDGHNGQKIYDAAVQMNLNKPTFIICNTVTGKGAPDIENLSIWHYRSPNKSEYRQAKQELAAQKWKESLI